MSVVTAILHENPEDPDWQREDADKCEHCDCQIGVWLHETAQGEGARFTDYVEVVVQRFMKLDSPVRLCVDCAAWMAEIGNPIKEALDKEKKA